MNRRFAIVRFSSRRNASNMPSAVAIRTPGRIALASPSCGAGRPGRLQSFFVRDRERTVGEGHFKAAHGRIAPVAFHLLSPTLIS
jgi:hypothetical protein